MISMTTLLPTIFEINYGLMYRILVAVPSLAMPPSEEWATRHTEVGHVYAKEIPCASQPILTISQIIG